MQKKDPLTEPDLPLEAERSDAIDLLLACAERVKLLVGGPLLIGLLAWSISWLIPDYFTSQAAINPTANVPADTPSMEISHHALNYSRLLLNEINSESVRAAASSAIAGGNRGMSAPELSARRDPSTGAIVLSATASASADAQAALQAVVNQLLMMSRPQGRTLAELQVTREELEDQLKKIRAAKKLMDIAIQDPGSTSRAAELVLARVSVIESEFQLQERIEHLDAKLGGLTPDAVVLEPTLTHSPEGPRRTQIALAAWLVGNVVLVLYVLIKEAFRTVQPSASQRRRWIAIRQRFGGKQESS